MRGGDGINVVLRHLTRAFFIFWVNVTDYVGKLEDVVNVSYRGEIVIEGISGFFVIGAAREPSQPWAWFINPC